MSGIAARATRREMTDEMKMSGNGSISTWAESRQLPLAASRCCKVLQGFAACCSGLQGAASSCSGLQTIAGRCRPLLQVVAASQCSAKSCRAATVLHDLAHSLPLPSLCNSGARTDRMTQAYYVYMIPSICWGMTADTSLLTSQHNK